MSRGRPPVRGLEDALRIAKARGRLLQFVQDGECPAEFAIRVRGNLVFVRVRRAVPFRYTAEQFGTEFRWAADGLLGLRESGQEIFELWLYSKKGNFRFFRIEEAGIREIGRDGEPLYRAGVTEGSPATPSPSEDTSLREAGKTEAVQGSV